MKTPVYLEYWWIFSKGLDYFQTWISNGLLVFASTFVIVGNWWWVGVFGIHRGELKSGDCIWCRGRVRSHHHIVFHSHIGCFWSPNSFFLSIQRFSLSVCPPTLNAPHSSIYIFLVEISPPLLQFLTTPSCAFIHNFVTSQHSFCIPRIYMATGVCRYL